jgi:hypothetical protein
MNLKLFLQTVFSLTLLLAFSNLQAQQWAPQFANLSSAIYRTGNVGLGTTTPAANLHIATQGGSLLNPDQKPTLVTGTPTSGGGSMGGAANYQIRLDKTYTQASYHWAIDGGNNLEFLREDNGSFSRKMILNGAGMRIFGEQLSIGTADEQLNLGYGSAGQFLAMGYRPVTTTTYQSLGSGGIVMYNNGSGSWGLATKDGGSLNINDDTRMIVTAQGNAGVGTLTPTQRMHLHDEKKAALRLDTDADGSWDVMADGMEGELVFNHDGTNTLMRIKGDGRVAIGTSSTPPSLDGGSTNIGAYRLYVEGGILTKEVRVRELWADYVFAPEYHLLSLPQVEAFIAENGHLPNTPSARDVAAQGINLGAATANQQEKIEELYLHLIEMNKRLEKLEAENAALKAAITEK